MKILKWVLGYLSIISVSTLFPFALSNPELHNQWLIIILVIPNIITIAWFMSEATGQPYNNANEAD